MISPNEDELSEIQDATEIFLELVNPIVRRFTRNALTTYE